MPRSRRQPLDAPESVAVRAARKAADVVVVGAGIVGLATARALQRRGVRRVIVAEAEEAVARHQTGRNSGVVHSGLFYPSGSLKARTCVSGRRALDRFAREEGIPHRRTGKLVVATRPEELVRLNALKRQGRANGLEGLVRLDRAALAERAPGLDAVAALEVRETGIIDFGRVARRLARKVGTSGGRVLTGCRVVEVAPGRGGLVVVTGRGEIEARHLIGCAGLQADRLALRCGLEIRSRIVPFRGQYYTVSAAGDPFGELPVYPVPDPELPFLGVHFTPDLAGRVEAGPTAVLALAREGYSRGDVSLRDLGDVVRFPGFWRLATRHWEAGVAEAASSMSKALFAHRARSLMPDLGASDLEEGRTGVRAQLVDPDGRLVDDFRLVGEGRTLHVLNAPSPAATAALAIGAEVADRAMARWDIG